jgi:phage terminase Nu1 subunit (DNA packaging protein)
MVTTDERSASDDPVPVSVDRIASIFDVTEKTVRSWIRAGLPTIKPGGKGKGNGALLDLAEVVVWYLAENALDVAKTRLATAQAEKHEMENDLRRGELADVVAVKKSWGDMVLAFRAKMLSLPMKLSPRLTNVADPSVISTHLRREIGAALTELANDETESIEPGIDAGDHMGEEPDSSTTRTNNKSVGRSKKKTKSRKQR